MNVGAVAVDLGATSGRFAVGRLVDGRIISEVVSQRPHAPVERNGRVEWNFDLLVGLAREAVAYASSNFDDATVGIDSWGVDHGFLAADGTIVQTPVAYRDRSHQAAFERLAPHQDELYALTGIQHQPFNTVYQLAARAIDQPELRGCDWLLIPDLIGYMLTGVRNTELTMASTTQLMGLDNRWCPRAFELAGWPVPDRQPTAPGSVVGTCEGVDVVSVGSHDTASAVLGLGPLQPSQAFLNVGTWSLLGAVVDRPLLADAGFTNERMTDGRIRYLANIPGFYIINRVHEELGLDVSVPDWLRQAGSSRSFVDVMHLDFYNPDRMTDALVKHLGHVPADTAEWASVALSSLVHTTVAQLRRLEQNTGRVVTEIRLSGGGSQSRPFAQALSDASGREVVAGPAESTVLGNLALQFWAQGAFGSVEDMGRAIAASFTTIRYSPR